MDHSLEISEGTICQENRRSTNIGLRLIMGRTQNFTISEKVEFFYAARLCQIRFRPILF